MNREQVGKKLLTGVLVVYYLDLASTVTSRDSSGIRVGSVLTSNPRKFMVLGYLAHIKLQSLLRTLKQPLPRTLQWHCA